MFTLSLLLLAVASQQWQCTRHKGFYDPKDPDASVQKKKDEMIKKCYGDDEATKKKACTWVVDFADRDDFQVDWDFDKAVESRFPQDFCNEMVKKEIEDAKGHYKDACKWLFGDCKFSKKAPAAKSESEKKESGEKKKESGEEKKKSGEEKKKSGEEKKDSEKGKWNCPASHVDDVEDLIKKCFGGDEEMQEPCRWVVEDMTDSVAKSSKSLENFDRTVKAKSPEQWCKDAGEGKFEDKRLELHNKACKKTFSDCTFDEEDKDEMVAVGSYDFVEVAASLSQTSESDSSLMVKVIAVAAISGVLGWLAASYTCVKKSSALPQSYATLPAEV